MTSLRATLATLAEGPDGYQIDAPEPWSQGRTLFGGITAALAYSAVMRAYGDLGPLRSAHFTFVGPASGRLSFRPALLRRGRSSAVASADCWNEDGMAARSTLVFGSARESAIAHDFTVPMAVPPPAQCEPFHKTTKPLKGFLGQFEFRLAAGARLFEAEKPPAFAVWARLREGNGDDPVAALLALADALPCAAMASFPKPAPVSTMTWSVDLHCPIQVEEGWHLIWSSSERAADGYSLQNMRVYNEAGEPLLSGRQQVAIFV